MKHTIQRQLRTLRAAGYGAAIALGLFGGGGGTPAFAQEATAGTTPTSADAALIEKGHQLAIAADCMACHTALDGGKPFAGGYGIASPMGQIYSSNITPSKTAGIGNYTEAQFARALREGVRADGARLYPAMPYTSYSGLADDDVLALYAYFMHAVKPVDDPAPVTNLPFPFGMRTAMAGWNMLFLTNKRFEADPAHDAQWNRGAYLTTVLAHCSACHTPRNALMAEDFGRNLGGAQLGAWYAPNITSDPVSGIGAWTDGELVSYLKTGRAPGKNQAAGPMAEAVQNSLQYLSDADLQSIVTYLRSTKPIRDERESVPAFTHGSAVSSEATLRGTSALNANGTLTTGAALFSGYCASCHQANGKGSPSQAYPSLSNNTATGSRNPSNLIAAILYGVDRDAGGQHVLMPSFGEDSYVQPLKDDQVAAIANYVLAQYGNADVTVTPDDVAVVRSGGPVPLLVRARPLMLPAPVLVVLLIALVIMVRRRRARRVARDGVPPGQSAA
ncbi:cytochrome c [Burkholderia sp. Bp9017]|uniref:Cytochrome c n=1 Tax=Burkholderia anthina TaxID=179879 RepID=A0A7T6VJG5_9BURK|nr:MULTISPECIES: cytochrome c [Burkholderia]MBY4870990.1 cytochrome c [Burkholderia anthina]QQK05093.1 cytochrome c [Burkholderia anthina]RQZ25527.1 cytochrome c [Burkholderia sp. Bp9017]RQZ33487.1 cytochrome c [Burkholderia sp. Bp9016]